MGLIIRYDEITMISGEYLPKEYQNLNYPGARRPTSIFDDDAMKSALRLAIDVSCALDSARLGAAPNIATSTDVGRVHGLRVDHLSIRVVVDVATRRANR